MVILHTKPLLNVHIVESVLQIFAARAATEMERMQIEERHALLSEAVEQSTECVVITDLDGTIVYVNPVFERNTGYSASEAIGKKPNILKSEKHNTEYYSKLWFALKTTGSWSGILINKRKDGTLFEEETNISTVSDSKGRPAYYVAVKRDVTNERRLEEQLRHAQKIEAIGQLTGGIAHDFNNFLTAILGFSSLLQMKFENDNDTQSNSYLQNIISAAEKAANMTNSLLAFSRKRIINIRPALLNDIIKGMERLLQRVITENVEFKTALTDKGTIIMADTGQIEQVLLNLVANARDAMPKGGTVFIKTEVVNVDEVFVRTHGYGKPGAYVLLSVSDTGIGMDEMTRERIFEPFFTTKEVGKGTGLGLSIVYGIIKQHNGYIDVNSESGKGATFNIYLPIIESTLESAEIKKEAIPKGGTETILLAEDELEVRRLVKTVLEEFGYKVIEAVDGEDAINRFMENKDEINLIILDVIMPKKNGREAYNKIKNISPDVKAIFISGYTEDIIKREDIFEMGLNFIAKPVSPSDLLEKIREVLDK
jgi:PAS domain S-box-containing protein